MTVTHVGSTKKFAENWDSIFGGSRGGKSKKKTAPSKSKPVASAKKKTGKPKAAKSAKKSKR